MKVSITGIDGVGKSTVIHHVLASETVASRFDVIHYPKFNLPPTHPFAGISATLEHLSDEADSLRSVPLKSISLFLTMRMSGHLENEVRHRTSYLLTERDSLIDSLAYGSLYGQTDGGSESEFKVNLSPTELTKLMSWVRTDPHFEKVQDLNDFYAQLLAYFSDSPDVLLNKLKTSYKAQMASIIIYLGCDQKTALKRIQSRNQVEGTNQEFHEKKDALAYLQRAYESVFTFIAQINPNTRILRFSTENMPAEKVAQMIALELQNSTQKLRVNDDDEYGVYRR